MQVLNWDYVAGLFDGEGHIGFGLGSGFVLQVSFTIGSDGLRQKVRAYLLDNGYHPSIQSPNQLYRTTASDEGYKNPPKVAVQRWDECDRLITELFPRVNDKQPNLAIAKEIVDLHTKVLSSGETLRSHISDFDILRHRLHALSKKGPRSLIPWVVAEVDVP